MLTFNLPRTGQPPIAFDGTEIAFASGSNLPSKRVNPRWHEIALYKTASGKYVAHVAFKCDSRYDTERDDAKVCETPDCIIAWLNAFNPTEHVRGWPLDKHRIQDERLREKLTTAFKTLVTQALAQTSEFSEKV